MSPVLQVNLADLAERAPKASLMTIGSLGAAALLGWGLAGAIWAAVAPIGGLGTPLAASPAQSAGADTSILARFDPFFRTEPEAEGFDVASLGLTLHAIRKEASGVGSAAIIGSAQSGQRSYQEGDQVAPGIVLKQVGADFVLLSRGGASVRLGFSALGGVLAPAPSPVPEAAAQAEAASAPAPGGAAISAADVSALTKALSIAPRRDGSTITGYRVSVLQNTPLVQRSGLQDGDVIVQVGDVTAADGELVDELVDTLKAGQPLTVRVERGGAVQTLTLR